MKMKTLCKKICSPIIHFFPKGFPLSKLRPLLFLQFTESFINNSIGSYAAFMVTDFGLVDNPNDIAPIDDKPATPPRVIIVPIAPPIMAPPAIAPNKPQPRMP